MKYLTRILNNNNVIILHNLLICINGMTFQGTMWVIVKRAVLGRKYFKLNLFHPLRGKGE